MRNAQNLGVSPSITIGPIRLEGRALLAPMSGISDLAMRRIARRFGAALVFSEMVAAETFLRGDTEASVRAEGEGLSPTRFRSSAAKRSALAETARRVVDAGAVLVDINMGCPSRRVSGALAGAALMRDLDNAERLIATVVEAVSVPVTVKMRLGWDETSLNAPDLARRAERAGAQMAPFTAARVPNSTTVALIGPPFGRSSARSRSLSSSMAIARRRKTHGPCSPCPAQRA